MERSAQGAASSRERAMASSSCRLEPGNFVGDLRQIRGARPRVELRQQRVVERRRLAPVHFARWIVEIAEYDRPCRTYRLAGGDDLTVRDAPILPVGENARGGDALHAVGALFHDAAHAHGDFRIALRS